MKIDKYTNEYSETSFWEILSSKAKHMGTDVLEKALMLYYALENPQIPARAKAVIYGALGYLIMPFDAVPDIIPVVGFADDIGVLVGAIATVSLYIDAQVKEQARQKISDWFD